MKKIGYWVIQYIQYMLASKVLKIGNPNKVDQQDSLHTVRKKVIQHKLFLTQAEGTQFWTLSS